MRILVDTNILLRAVQLRHPVSRVAINAIKTLHRQQHVLCLAPQNIVEFWNVCTRPIDVNGFGMGLAAGLCGWFCRIRALSTTGTDRYVKKLKRMFTVVQDSLQTFEVWHELVVRHGVTGTKVHDARLVGVMRVHGISSILTFNVKDFIRYDGVTTIQPDTVV